MTRPPLVGLCGLLASGALLSAQSPPRVDVGTHCLSAIVTGSVGPAIVFESGLGVTMDDWAALAESLGTSRTVRYDRAGIGLSSSGTEPHTAVQIARDLHAALAKLGVAPPYVLVAHSMGAIFARVFANRYPAEISGLVLIDPTDENYRALQRRRFSSAEFQAMDARRTAAVLEDSSAAVRAEFLARDSSFAQARAAWPLPAVPTIVLTSTQLDSTANEQTRVLKSLWIEAHTEFVQRAHAEHVLVADAGHNIYGERPAIVLAAIRKIVARARRTQ